jgi:hypothetical protein
MKAAIFGMFCLLSAQLSAQAYSGKVKAAVPEIAKGAGCIPPSKSTYLELNNVRAMIHTGGNMWQVPGQNYSRYEVPKNSGIMALFTSALWLGGVDVNGQLKLAALRYKQGNDYWTGPLTESAAEITPDDCLKFDNHFVTNQDEVRLFDAWFAAGLQDQENGTNTQSALFPNYQIPDFIKSWPAHGDVSKGQDYYMAPFFDRDENGEYNWENGDYPWYDFKNDKECKVDRKVSLYGDLNFWWVMNDKGNIHTETGGDPIGMEVRAQAFAFATNDEVNNMTFYNYELINRSTQTLYGTYFGMFVDGALGDPFDDFVGCDVGRGLGYFYNGDNYDGDNSGFKGYGSSPPAVGVDFFEGPYQDNDLMDNAYGIGVNEALNGIGYGDGVVDNERFGMRRFLYYINTGGGANDAQTDPEAAFDYYNFLRGRWKDGSTFCYGGNGHFSDPEANTSVPADFMFPGDTDPLGWGTNGSPQPEWTEQTANNFPYDRRFLQSAGPFVLKPGAVNNITVGIAWARSAGGDPFESVKMLQRADDKAQALFENCFRVLDGPNSPDLAIQELENELILTLSNSSVSNNYMERYEEFDPFIVAEDSLADKYYRFQGYQVFQLKGPDVSISDLGDNTKARQVAQCDVEDGVTRLVNFEFDEDLQASIPSEKVDGENKGISHSFRVTEDLFASGVRTLVNFKTYYYIAIAYAYNSYKDYDPTDPSALDGQKKPYIASRKAAIGETASVAAMPHNSAPEANGTAFFAAYGFQPQITRLDGRGNGQLFTGITSQSEDLLLASGKLDKLTFNEGAGPIDIKVIDPLNVAGGYYECRFTEHASGEIDSSGWVIYRYTSEGGDFVDSVSSDHTIAQNNEQLIPQWGISARIRQHNYYDAGIPGPEYRLFAEPIGSNISFSEESKQWLTFIGDQDIYSPLNWIRSGNNDPADSPVFENYEDEACYPDKLNVDPEQKYEKLLGGGITHGSLVGYNCAYMPLTEPPALNFLLSSQLQGTLARASGVDIVVTSDRSKWTRCAVVELCPDASLSINNAQPGTLRESPSVDKNGDPDNSGTTGMGWFPGYAIDVESGYRLHMAFGENSFMQAGNGGDMLWNPTSQLFGENGTPVLGGMHPIYVFGVGINNTACPYYDGVNNWVYEQYQVETNASYRNLYTNLMWVACPLLAENAGFMSSDVRMQVRLNTEYSRFTATGSNGGLPHYSWSMDNYATDRENVNAHASVLDLINIVPNPYYAYSEYERNKVDTRVRITNLPERCTVSIFTVSGKQVVQFRKDSPTTWYDWNLNNSAGLPVTSGVYIVHIDVPDVGETVRKVFINMRLPDLTGF